MENLSLYYDMIVKKDNKVIKKYRKRKCHSFVKQFLCLLSSQSSGSFSEVDIGGTTRNLDYIYPTFYIPGTVGTTTDGPVVGTGITTVTINDYKIETLITHGTGSGQLQYSVVTYGAPTTTATGSTFIMTRVFTNNSGGNVTINEIGIIVYHYNAYYYLIVHDNLTSPITLANGETVTLNYTFQTTI
jgi:hypothetical protein